MRLGSRPAAKLIAQRAPQSCDRLVIKMQIMLNLKHDLSDHDQDGVSINKLTLLCHFGGTQSPKQLRGFNFHVLSTNFSFWSENKVPNRH
jgi:hypothetical protein